MPGDRGVHAVRTRRHRQCRPALRRARTAGATEIYRVGAPRRLPPWRWARRPSRVCKGLRAGNAYVVAAKRLLFGHVAVDLLPGPSEVLVLADDTANPRFIAAGSARAGGSMDPDTNVSGW